MAEVDNEAIQERKRDFANFFEEKDYPHKIRKMIDAHNCRLIVSLDDLREQHGELAKGILTDPFININAAELALKEVISTHPDGPSFIKDFDDKVFVGFEGSCGAQHVTPRGLSAGLLGKLVMVEGIVSKCSLIHPKVVRSVHYCPETDKSIQRSYRDATSMDGLPTFGVYPKQDDEGHPLVTEYGLSVYKNHQTMTVQEMPERAPTGQLPRSVDMVADDDLVDAAKPGDRVQIIGVYRALPSKSNGSTSGVFRTVLLANNIRILGKEAFMPTLTSTDVKNINKLATEYEEPFKLLARSLAPSIHGHEHIKEGILALLLGGEEKNLARGGHIRGDVNLLLVGDPSCGKSQLLRFVQNTAPHCITTTGRGSSGVGLTAAVTTDQDTGERRLEAGAMVLADRGIVCIDEFDKMSDLDRVSIHEVMEQQTVTIAKAGIHTSLNARCSVLGAANPVYGQYNPYQTPMDNIGLPDSLLSRFDLLFIVLDKMDADEDNRLAAHVLRSHTYRNPNEQDGTPMVIDSNADVIVADDPKHDDEDATSDMFQPYNKQLHGKRHGRRGGTAPNGRLLTVDFVKKFIMYAKARVHPVLSTEAASIIANEYAALRDKESDMKTLPVTARTLETMIRLATAHAKARLGDIVSVEDAHAAFALINFAYFNEAKPQPRPRKRRSGTNDDSGEDQGGSSDDDDDGGHGGQAGKGPTTPRSQQHKKRSAASTPSESSGTKPSAGSNSSGTKGKEAMTAAEDDPFAFEDTPAALAKTGSAKDSTAVPGSPATSAGKRTTPSRSKTTTPAKSTVAVDDTDLDIDEKQEPPVSKAQAVQIRKMVAQLFKDRGDQATTMLVLMGVLEKAGLVLTASQLDYVLAEMAEANEIMVHDDQIFRI